MPHVLHSDYLVELVFSLFAKSVIDPLSIFHRLMSSQVEYRGYLTTVLQLNVTLECQGFG